MSAMLDEKKLADLLGVSLACVRRWRFENRGPRFVKLSTAVRYRPEDVQAWIASCPVGGSQIGGAQ